MATSASPCAACKFLRRKCTQECVFSPYFPPDQPLKFANVHKVFGASNVAKILMELNPNERADTVLSLAYEADARLKDPVYGCVGTISILQYRLKQIQTLLQTSKHELATYIGPSAMMPMLNPQPHPGAVQMYSNGPLYNGPVRPTNVPMLTLQGSGMAPDEQHQQQMVFEAHEKNQLVDAARELELLRNFQQQQQPVSQQSGDPRFNAGFDPAGPSRQGNPSQFTQLREPVGISPALALGGSYDNNVHEQQQQHFQQQFVMPPPQFQLSPLHGDGGGAGRSRNNGSNL